MSVSIDTQELIVTSFLKNSHTFAICKDEITDGYFTSAPLKIIYKALQTYYKKYSNMPGLNELLITIEDCYYPQIGASLPDVKDTCCRLWDYPEPEETFIIDKIESFLRSVRSSVALKNFLEQKKLNPNSEDDTMVMNLVKSLDVHLRTTKVYQMTSVDQLREMRETALGSAGQSKVIKTMFDTLNKSLMFGGWQPGTINMIVACPGTGKSMYLVNEGVNALKQGFTVLHIFIGDMVENDGSLRYLSCLSGTPLNSLVMASDDEKMQMVSTLNQQYNNCFTRLSLVAYPSLSLTVDMLIEEINQLEKHSNTDYDMIIIDYPDNLIQDGVSLYTDGGILYSSLERMSRLTKSVVLVASQPSKAYWNAPIVPLEAAAESSKKQQAVDVMLTFNTEFRGANFGSLFLAKIRRGEVGNILRIKTDFACCRMEEINEGTFNAMRDAYTNTKNQQVK